MVKVLARAQNTARRQQRLSQVSMMMKLRLLRSTEGGVDLAVKEER